jgi:outer membrane protein assembly factor BamE (lipoprotein component of BamABCDE complex)
MRTAKIAMCLSLVAAALALGGCLFGSESRTEYQGKYVSPQTMEQVKAGQSKDFVLSLLGEPTSRTQAGNGTEVWKYAYREEKSTEGSVFLLLHSSKTTETEGAVYVELKNGRVTRTWRDVIAD